MVVSSANIYTNPDTTDVGKSFVNIEKSVGPKTDPCGMPYDTGSIPEGTPFTIYNLEIGAWTVVRRHCFPSPFWKMFVDSHKMLAWPVMSLPVRTSAGRHVAAITKVHMVWNFIVTLAFNKELAISFLRDVFFCYWLCMCKALTAVGNKLSWLIV